MALMTWPMTSDGAGAVTYTANEWRTLLTNLFTEGILGASSFAVTQRAAGANMTLDIAAGVAVVTGDHAAGQGRYLVRDDAADTEAVTISAANPTNPRIDRVGILIRDPSEGGAAGRDATFSVVTGTPAASPSAPAAPSSFLTLALVTVGAGVTTIVNANISDQRSFSRLMHEVVDTAALDDDAVTAAKIVAGAVGTTELADDAVTADKLAAATAGSLLSSSIQYAKLGDVVHVWTAPITSAGSATLPSGFRPATAVQAAKMNTVSSTAGTVQISTAGVITHTTGDAFSLSFVAA